MRASLELFAFQTVLDITTPIHPLPGAEQRSPPQLVVSTDVHELLCVRHGKHAAPRLLRLCLQLRLSPPAVLDWS